MTLMEQVRAWFTTKPTRSAAFSAKTNADTGDHHEMPVRQSGPSAMRDPPRKWENVDEASDESFPASDPSAKY